MNTAINIKIPNIVEDKTVTDITRFVFCIVPGNLEYSPDRIMTKWPNYSLRRIFPISTRPYNPYSYTGPYKGRIEL
jgi:hypothetical protein